MVTPLASIPLVFGGALALACTLPACKRSRAPAPAVALEAPSLAAAPPAPPDLARPPEDALRTASGIIAKVLKPGNGTIRPVTNDSVKVAFTGWTKDGVAFTHGESTFHVARAIPGWSEILPDMVEGEARRLWVPQALTYPQIQGAPSGMLVFDLELLSITPGPTAPKDLTSAPHGDLSSRILTAGTGTEHPGVNDLVNVTFASWTVDGKPFQRADQVPIPIAHAIAGWREILPQMVVGETRRIWVPPQLAYVGQPDAPARTLVFDLTLNAIAPGPTAPSDVAAAPEDAAMTKRGLASKVLTTGTGRVHPRAGDSVRVRYASWRRDGRLVDSTGDEPVVRPVGGPFEGWTEGLRLMVKGETRTLWIPSSLGPHLKGSVAPPDVTIVVELVDILSPPKAPPDVKSPPRSAVVERDGLASKVLTKGTGTVHPSERSLVTVHFAGWTSDGKLINSTYTRGSPATVAVGGTIPGWTEALQLMVEGEKRRVWIPKRLAYQGAPNEPKGMLVFDIELQKIQPSTPM